MHAFSTRLTFIFDPGHGWLKVPLVEIATLGIEGQISPYSFIEGQYAFLEEDCDCPRYLEARVAQGIPQPEITEQYVDRFERPYRAFHDPSLDAAFWGKLRR
ncbi:MAG: hypothetical protein ACRDHL_02250 [Candidatus Promineifilaceae bacterium]